MAIYWRLKTFLSQKRGIHKATELQKHVVIKTGVLISVQNLCNYLNKKPKVIRLTTLELLCTALSCELQDFCEVKPSTSLLKKTDTEVKRLSWQNTPLAKRAIENFPDPKQYE